MENQALTFSSSVNSIPFQPAQEYAAAPASGAFNQAFSNNRCLAITGGKGGVGKSNLSVNLAYELGELGKKVVLLDADFGLANDDLLCGVNPDFNLGHVFQGEKSFEEIIFPLTDNVSLIPGGTGVERLRNITRAEQSYIFAELKSVNGEPDFCLIDTAAGNCDSVLGVLEAASEIIVIVTPEPASIIDAYATIKNILRTSPGKPVWVVVNNVRNVADADQIFVHLKSTVYCFLNHTIKLLGVIPSDAAVMEAVCDRTPVVYYAPQSAAARSIRQIANELFRQTEEASPSIKTADSYSELPLVWI